MIGARIRRYREQANFTQEQLGAVLGKDSSVISKIESGDRRVLAEELKKIADALGVTVTELLDDNSDEEPTQKVG